jgi:hypothetical protein
MDEMRQLVRIMVRLMPASESFLSRQEDAEEELGGQSIAMGGGGK